MKHGIGAQVIIEPGMTGAQIDQLFCTLKDASFHYARIRMFELYMKDATSAWDFSLFDQAFRAAEKYDIQVFATLFPATGYEDIGGFKFPSSAAHFESVKTYIQAVVRHFSPFPSCYGWVLVNEPGLGSLPRDEFMEERYQEYLLDHPQALIKENGFPGMDFSRERFLLSYTKTYLHALAKLVHRESPDAHVHLNPHAIFSAVLGECDFPGWREFLSSLGGSAHASWHFDDFQRSEYTVAMAMNSEILRSGAGTNPWLMTEIQGGNNIYTGGTPICPTAEETIQWLMTVLFHEGKGGIFWSFNQRHSGLEAAEWGMLDLKGKPTDRVTAAASVAHFIEEHRGALEEARVEEARVTLLYSRQSMWVESRVVPIKQHDRPGRSGRAGILATQAYFQAFTELGIACEIAEINEFEATERDRQGHLLILANQVGLSDEQLRRVGRFAESGGTVLLSGLTGFYDLNACCRHMGSTVMDELVGAELKEVKYVSGSFALNGPGIELNSQMMHGILQASTAKEWIHYQEHLTGTRNQVGRGEILWLCSPVGVEAKVNGSDSLKSLLRAILSGLDLEPAGRPDAVFSRCLTAEGLCLTLLINKSAGPQLVPLATAPELIFSSRPAQLDGDSITLEAEQTVVVRHTRNCQW